jgi:hypothetical protein
MDGRELWAEISRGQGGSNGLSVQNGPDLTSLQKICSNRKKSLKEGER